MDPINYFVKQIMAQIDMHSSVLSDEEFLEALDKLTLEIEKGKESVKEWIKGDVEQIP